MSSIFNKEDRNRLNDEAKKARDERNKADTRELLDPAHPHVLVATAIEEGKWKHNEGGEVIYVQFTLEVLSKPDREKYRPISARWNVHKTDGCKFDVEMGIKIFSDFLANAYGADGIPDATGMGDLITKLKKYIEVPFRAAIRHKERLWVKKEEGQPDKGIKTTEVILYYTGKMEDQTFKATKASARIIPMSDSDAKEFARYNTGGGAPASAGPDAHAFDLPAGTDDEDPFK